MQFNQTGLAKVKQIPVDTLPKMKDKADMGDVANNEKQQKKLGGRSGAGFKPGQSGNPSGRPKEVSEWRDILRKFLHSKHPQAEAFNAKANGTDEVHSRLDVILRRLEKEDPQFLIEQGFGKATLRQEISGPEGAACEFVVKVTGNEMP